MNIVYRKKQKLLLCMQVLLFLVPSLYFGKINFTVKKTAY